MNQRLIPALLSLMALAVSCDVHELPEGTPHVDLTLDLVFDEAMPSYTTIGLGTRAAGSSSSYVARYTVKLYEDRDGRVDQTRPAYTYTFEREKVMDLSTSITFTFPAGDYQVLVWTDFVDRATGRSSYKTGDFREITLWGAYRGSTDFRDAFRGEVRLDGDDFRQNDMHARVTVEMLRPLAKFRVVATDRENLLAHLAAKSGVVPASFDVSRYRTRFRYPQFLPDTYDIFQDEAVDSRTGCWFDAPMRELEDGSLEIGFDYVFVNGEEGKVAVAFDLYDGDGVLLGSQAGIMVPLKRSHVTTVTGEFLTGGKEAGITIDPEFDGTFTVVL
ncbi:MAG: FimB/Mfa2 family fimbrial subunit [Bacteroidales bacterium]|nr:FimB/Mfa2 family fimbrial subunit [Bacteroidales bacterium]